MTKQNLLEIIESQQKNIVFDELLHKYWVGGKEVISVTQLLKKHGITKGYEGVPSEILKAASERGNLVHKDIELWINENCGVKTEEGYCYTEFIASNELIPVKAEFMIGNEICAGCCDAILIDKDNNIYLDDHKTGFAIDENAIAWQLSIYAYLLGIYDEVKGIFCSHLPKSFITEFLPLNLIEKAKVESLFEKEQNGEIWRDKSIITRQLMTENEKTIVQMQKNIEMLEENLKKSKEMQEKFKLALLSEMQARDCVELNIGNIQFKRKMAYTQERIDSAKLKAELPDIAEKYSKTINVKESLTINIKKEGK